MKSFVAVVCVSFSLRCHCTPAPSGLLTDFQKQPALGVGATPRFTWIVNPCGDVAEQRQTAYQIVVSGDNGENMWDSGKVTSSDSTSVSYGGRNLTAGSQYKWTVSIWTAAPSGKEFQCAASLPGKFVTSLFDGWHSSAKFIGLVSSATFGYFRKEVDISADVVSASAFVTAAVDDVLLSGYKLYIDAAFVNLGPGRGEATVRDGDGTYRNLPYTTLDVTSHFTTPGKHVLALQTMHKPPSVILQINLRLRSGTTRVLFTDGTWQAFNGDAHRKPAAPQYGRSAGTGFLEYIDARAEPVGWTSPGFKADAAWSNAVATSPSSDQQENLHAKMTRPMQVYDVPIASIRPVASVPTEHVTCGMVAEHQVLPLACPDGSAIEGISFASFGTPNGKCPGELTKDPKCDASSTAEIVRKACVGKKSCSVIAESSSFGDPCWGAPKALAIEVQCPPTPATSPNPPQPVPRSFIADFGREFQGGLKLAVQDGKAGTNVHISCGEALKDNSVQSTWGWEFDWTLRDGAQVLEQHKYMECRFVSLNFTGVQAPPNFSLSAWKTHYEWDDADTHFDSSNSTLNSVFELMRYTLQAGVLDTYTDSNTRERRPYEADGFIASAARILVQREYMWPRHSHAWVIQYPTSLVEWKQLTPFMGWQDYMATGQPDLARAFTETMYDRTMISYLENGTGILDTSKMGQHIVDWMPKGREEDETVGLGEFTASNHTSVSNAYCAHGLELLSKMMKAAGDDEKAADFGKQASDLKQAITKYMWNGTAYCDGVCSEVGGKSLIMSNMFTLFFGMVPPENIPSVWETIKNWGLEEIGDYGAFFYLGALSSSYYAPLFSLPDDGSAVLTALTKCDKYSWCSGLRDDNLTMTRESWHDGTYSHPWGTSGMVGFFWGILGVHQTAPGFASATIRPKLGSLTHAEGTVPTLRGYIKVKAQPASVDVELPCNVDATLCLPRSSADKAIVNVESTTLLLDGVTVTAVQDGNHICAKQPVTCGAGGAARRLTSSARVLFT